MSLEQDNMKEEEDNPMDLMLGPKDQNALPRDIVDRLNTKGMFGISERDVKKTGIGAGVVAVILGIPLIVFFILFIVFFLLWGFQAQGW